ncbi:tRNA pseudouridine(13) synthase TruD [Simiduia agarivorans]|uniref:tRNA pseudouridine synthase D n=1 Tax=Simiduia agarivorans (strain DSM 21679 / JCM 13881 / BCRC 17597 / SA1) TaxID=1117647 RepID=K4KGS8_SIMAS|nr:tRNA pseudouridine(13) synthase TruD [Simiduia agarivorans]AFU98191.1 tRNA pseudouridine synthase D [Simiduia agarivorans SA1 = DSM 21679]
MNFSLDFPFAYGRPAAVAGFRQACEDFVVVEQLGLEPAGQGEHWLVEILKRDDNTPWVAKQLARLCGVSPRDVGYCGMKDRRAVTRQWFSVYLPKGDAPDWAALNSDTIHWLQSVRHTRKLRRGEHAGNTFEIRLRDCASHRQDIEQRLSQIARLGVPNYFGEQRFGRDADNLQRVETVLAKRGRKNTQEAMVLSAARSWLFNQVLAARVQAGNWCDFLPGETELTGPLWGRGRNPAPESVCALEMQALAPWQTWLQGLEHAGLSQERRALILQPRDLQWHWDGDDLLLQFGLPPGQFATALLRELAQLKTPDLDIGSV